MDKAALPLILCIETTTEVCSVCLAQGDRVLARETSEGRNHAADVHPFMQKIFNQTGITPAQLQAVAIGAGPGSYTGLRIGWAAAKGLCYALSVPLIAIDTLQAMAAGMQARMPDAAYFMPMMDARRLEVYTAVYDNQLNTVQNVQPLIFEPGMPLPVFTNLVYGGNGAGKAMPFMPADAVYVSDVKTLADNIVALAYTHFNEKRFLNLAYSEPAYLKEARITAQKRPTTF